MSLLDAMVGVLGNQALNYLVSGVAPRRMGNIHPNIAPYQVFPVADGQLIIAVGNDGQFERFCKTLGLDSLLQNPDYRSNAARVDNRENLVSTITEKTSGIPKKALLGLLESAGIPAGPIKTLEGVFADPQVLARKMRIELANSGAKGGNISGIRTPITFSDSELHLENGAPRLGKHTRQILGD